ncbi:MAG: transposase [Desulfobacterales bacterium]|nr:transposase [Desulfobacterales bacterium]
MSSKPRRKYDSDFKRNAVLLCAEPGRSVTQVAESLGINKDLLYRWWREYHRANGQSMSLTLASWLITEMKTSTSFIEIPWILSPWSHRFNRFSNNLMQIRNL